MFEKKQLDVLEVIVDRKGKTLVIQEWASEECFPGGPLGDLSKIFLGGGKSGEICFFLLETKKTTFFAELFKIQGTKAPPVPPC